MDAVSAKQECRTLRTRFDGDVCFIQIYRPDANNSINDELVGDFGKVLRLCEESIKIIVLEGLPDVFCFGADFSEIQRAFDRARETGSYPQQNPEPLYDVWQRLAFGPYVTIAHVRGKANAGGMGFVAACDIVLSEGKALFSLSELLFGLMPACVLPFLIRRIGFARANHLTLSTQPISAQQALAWGLVDACEENSEALLRRYLQRLRRLSKAGISHYKRYVNQLDELPLVAKHSALEANKAVFSDSTNLELIARYVHSGKFPWEN